MGNEKDSPIPLEKVKKNHRSLVILSVKSFAMVAHM